MEIFQFDENVGVQIKQFDSSFVMSKVIQTTTESRVGCIYIHAQGVIGFHQAVTDQLFLVVQGNGWVTSKDRTKIPVTSGCAVFWNKGEWHESGTSVGMTAIVIESEQLEPTKFMPLKQKF